MRSTADVINELREFLMSLPAGEIRQASLDLLKPRLKAAWDQFSGCDSEGMVAYKLDRMEQVRWQLPKLTFVIERHGGTVMGSTRGELHLWTLDVGKLITVCNPEHSYRQLRDRDAPLRAGAVAQELAEVIVSGKDDPRLKRLSGSRVRVLVPTFILGKFKQTQEGRRRRFRKALHIQLEQRGWQRVPNMRDVYEERQGTG